MQTKLHEGVKQLTTAHQNGASSTANDQALKEIAQLKLDSTTLKQENLVLKHKIEKLQSNLSQVQALQAENLDLKSKAENLGKQLIAHMTSGSTNAIELEKLKLDNNFLKQNLDTLKTQLGSTHSGTATLTQELEKARADLTKLKKENLELEKKKGEVSELAVKLQGSRDEFIELMTRYSRLEAEVERLRPLTAHLEQEIEAQKRANSNFSKDSSSLNQEKDQLKLQLTMLREESIEAKLRIQSLESKLSHKEEEFSTIESERTLLRIENEKIKSEIDHLRTSMSTIQATEHVHKASLEVEKKSLAVIADLEEQVRHLKSAEGKTSHHAQLLAQENEMLQTEIRRLAGELEALAAEKEQAAGTKRYSAVTFKMLEDQLALVEEDNKRLVEERNKATLDAERTKNIETKVKEQRAEVDLLKRRNEYLETELTQKVKEWAASRDKSDELLQQLREENRHLKEKEMKTGSLGVASHMASPLMGPKSATGKQGTDVDERQTKEKLMLEINLAKSEKENKDKEARITSLESRIGDLNRELEKMKLIRRSHQEVLAEQELKEENSHLKNKLTELKMRETELLSIEEQKDKIIAHLQQSLKENALNTSHRHE